MKKLHLIFIALFSAFLLFSCELFYPKQEEDRTIHIITMGFSYADIGDNMLENTLRDQHGMTEQLIALAESSNCSWDVIEFNDGEYSYGWKYPQYDGGNNPVRRGTRYRSYSNAEYGKDTAYTPIKENSEEGIKNAVADIIKENLSVKENDLLFFYYSGHGDVNGLVIPYHDKSGYTFFSPETLFGILDSFDCFQMLIFDCCFSGIFVQDGDLEGTIGYDSSEGLDKQTISNPFEIIANAFIKGFEKGNSGYPKRFSISAASPNQESWDSDQHADHDYAHYYGAFTIWALDYLGYDFENLSGSYRVHGKALTAAGLYEHAYENLTKYTRMTATPNITASRYNLVLFDF